MAQFTTEEMGPNAKISKISALFVVLCIISLATTDSKASSGFLSRKNAYAPIDPVGIIDPRPKLPLWIKSGVGTIIKCTQRRKKSAQTC